jgi:hypothetical protein
MELIVKDTVPEECLAWVDSEKCAFSNRCHSMSLMSDHVDGSR